MMKWNCDNDHYIITAHPLYYTLNHRWIPDIEELGKDDDITAYITTDHLGNYRTIEQLLKKLFDELGIIDSEFFPEKIKITTPVRCADITRWK